MLDNLKTIAKIGKELESLKGAIRELNVSVESINRSVNEMKTEIAGIRKTEEEHCKNISGVSGILRDFREISQTLKDEIYDFRLVKSEMQKKALENFHSDLKEELARKLIDIKSDAENFKKMKKEIEAVTHATFSLSQEIEKFNRLSQKISLADFDLNRHKRNLDAMDKEKLMLLKRIDSLERMISKMRRVSS